MRSFRRKLAAGSCALPEGPPGCAWNARLLLREGRRAFCAADKAGLRSVKSAWTRSISGSQRRGVAGRLRSGSDPRRSRGLAAPGGVDRALHLMVGRKTSRPRRQPAPVGASADGGDGVADHVSDGGSAAGAFDGARVRAVRRHVCRRVVVAVGKVLGARGRKGAPRAGNLPAEGAGTGGAHRRARHGVAQRGRGRLRRRGDHRREYDSRALRPMFWFLLGGPVLAMGFKAVSTLDSMVGYLDERYRDIGWSSAKLDDLLNFIPARICGLLLCLSAFFCGLDGRNALRIMRRDHANHLSPNCAWSEGAAAGALHIRLGGDASLFRENRGKAVDRGRRPPAAARGHSPREPAAVRVVAADGAARGAGGSARMKGRCGRRQAHEGQEFDDSGNDVVGGEVDAVRGAAAHLQAGRAAHRAVQGAEHGAQLLRDARRAGDGGARRWCRRRRRASSRRRA